MTIDSIPSCVVHCYHFSGIYLALRSQNIHLKLFEMKDDVAHAIGKGALQLAPAETLLMICLGFAAIMVIISLIRGDNNFDL